MTIKSTPDSPTTAGRDVPHDAGADSAGTHGADAHSAGTHEAGTALVSRLGAEHVKLAYGDRVVSDDLTVHIPPGSFTVIIGPNACGKSTLLRGLSRLLKPRGGEVVLDGKAISTYRTKEVARIVGLLPQSSTAPEGITVADLVARGRYPHQGLIRQWSHDDEMAVNDAMEVTGVSDLRNAPVDQLSGGQRQRVWTAMALAQQTPILLLDEPTTYLDISHQYSLLNLFATLNRQGTTIVAVLHDLNQAARYATHLIAMKQGRIVAEGTPREVVTEQTMREVFDVDALVMDDPITGTPMVVPR
ncbi:ABC transporter ATP-binding protein [Propionibacterium freudenreichii]|uniref:ABC transporter ATP-binding protein n=2 Tax=Propionibacterium freudenreichii TaxID=1744 RepID=UPI0005A5C57A|nr:ABC transporter ATP-binding protein [Propionibacterium freudenreichii]CEI49564.1 FepC [Propionibacterium freudenreichii]